MKPAGIAPCGLDCAQCNLYLAAHDPHAAAMLVDWFRSRGWIDEDEGAEAVQRRAPFCMGCRDKSAVQWCGDCSLKRCCAEKVHATCGDCPAFPCEGYLAWTVDTPHHQAAMESLLAGRQPPAATVENHAAPEESP